MTEYFAYRDAELHAEGTAVRSIVEAVGTPVYIYARTAIEARWREFDDAFGAAPHLVCYSVKANPSLAILSALAGLGSGFDIVSEGELRRVVRAGGDPARVLFSGVGKTADEMRYAMMQGIHCFNVESEPELERLDQVAATMGRRAPVSLRVNPDVDAKTHPYIATGMRDNKFGIPIEDVPRIAARLAGLEHVTLLGIDCHIGSQLTALEPFRDAAGRIFTLVRSLMASGHRIEHVDLGGGLGVQYEQEQPPAPRAYAGMLLEALHRQGLQGLRILIEPGRAIVGAAGVLVTRVEYLKRTPAKQFAIVDAGMNDLMRPALYDAWHDVVPVSRHAGPAAPEAVICDIVGPVCESADFLGRARVLRVAAGDLLAIKTAGAYGASMGSNYNSRPMPPEVMVSGDRFQVVRARQPFDALWAQERIWNGPGEG